MTKETEIVGRDRPRAKDAGGDTPLQVSEERGPARTLILDV